MLLPRGLCCSGFSSCGARLPPARSLSCCSEQLLGCRALSRDSSLRGLSRKPSLSTLELAFIAPRNTLQTMLKLRLRGRLPCRERCPPAVLLHKNQAITPDSKVSLCSSWRPEWNSGQVSGRGTCAMGKLAELAPKRRRHFQETIFMNVYHLVPYFLCCSAVKSCLTLQFQGL